jgi:peptide/nickel transport system substrate-binding protein
MIGTPAGMTRTRLWFPVLVSFVLVSTVVSGERPRYGDTIRIETQGTIRSIDPAAPADSVEASLKSSILPLVFETLVAVEPAGGMRPVLASSWATDTTAARWRFTLRRGVTLHDGSMLEASHVVSALAPHLPGAQLAAEGQDVVIDTAGRPDLLWELSDLRRAIVVRASSGEPIGTGPFRIGRLEESRLLLQAHDGYWGSRPFLDGVRIDFDRPHASQLTNIETGQADLVTVRPIDVRRLTQRQLRVVASRLIELFALVFEPHLARPADRPVRRTLAGAIDRDSMVRVLLQGYGEPARALLPAWLSGYPPFVVEERGPLLSRPAVAGLPLSRRSMILRVTAGDAVARAVADRIAVDAREAGFTVMVQAPTGLAPRADLRLIRVTLPVTSPERSLSSLMTALGQRALVSATREPAPPAGAPLQVVANAERALLEQHVIVPIVHAPSLYAIGGRVESFEGPIVLPTGGLDLASVWLRPAGGGQPAVAEVGSLCDPARQRCVAFRIADRRGEARRPPSLVRRASDGEARQRFSGRGSARGAQSRIADGRRSID